MNNVILRGRLTADAEVTKNAGEKNKTVARFTLAVHNRTQNNNDDDTDFIKIVAFDSLADTIQKTTGKGSEILLTGRLHTYSYNKDNKKVYIIEVIAEKVESISKCTAHNDGTPNHNNRHS